jgi:hypothetical protein
MSLVSIQGQVLTDHLAHIVAVNVRAELERGVYPRLDKLSSDVRAIAAQVSNLDWELGYA